MAHDVVPRSSRILTRQAHPAPGVCLLAVDGVPCPRQVQWRGLCATHFQRLQKERRLDEFALPSKQGLKNTLALKPAPDPGFCRLVVNGEPCPLPAGRRGLCRRHYASLWQRPDVNLDEYCLPPLPRRMALRKDLVAGECRVLASQSPCRQQVHARGLCSRHYKLLAAHPNVMDRIAFAAPREVRYDLRLRPRAGRCRVSEDGAGCSQVSETRGLCRRHYGALRSKPSLLDQIALPSDARVARVFKRAQVVGPVLSCVVVENGVRCSGPLEIRGLCRRHHRILGSHADYSLLDFYLPEREIVLGRKPPEEVLDGLCVAVEDGGPCSRPPFVRGLCRHHQRLAARLGMLDSLALPPRSQFTPFGAGNDRPHYYIDKNVLYDHADLRVFGTTGQGASATLVEEIRAGRVRASVSLDAVKSTYSHVRYRLVRPPDEGGRGLSDLEADAQARAYTQQTFYGGGAWRFVQLDAASFSRVVTAAAGTLSLEDAMEFQAYQQERVARAGPTLFVTRDSDFPEGVHPAHVVRALGAKA